MNIQDYQWQLIQEGDKVIARPVNPFHKTQFRLAYIEFESEHRLTVYQTLNLPAGQTIDGKDLELVDIYELNGERFSEFLESFNGDVSRVKHLVCIRPKTQPIEDKKDYCDEIADYDSKCLDIDPATIVQKTLEYVAKNAPAHKFEEDFYIRIDNILAMRDDILKEIRK